MKKTDQSYIDWWKNTKENDLKVILDDSKELFSSSDIPTIYVPILYKFKKNSQLKSWNREIFQFSERKIKEIEGLLGKETTILILLKNIDLFISIYENLLDLENRIELMNRYNGSEQEKAKMFSVGIFNDLLNKAFSNSLKLFIEFYSEIEGKKLYQKNLGPQIECLASPKRGFKLYTDLSSEPGIRNAMSHDGVRFNGLEILFSYTRGQEQFQEQKSIYDFKRILLELFDGTSAVLLSWIGYLCDNNIGYEQLICNHTQQDSSLFFERLNYSTMTIDCIKIEEVKIHSENKVRKQTNIEFQNSELEDDSRIFFGLSSAEKIFIDRGLSEFDTVMVTFNSPKTLVSFFRVQGLVLKSLAQKEITLEEAVKTIIKSGDVMMFSENKEERNQNADTFMHYPDFENEDYYITEINDISLEDKKRFKAVVYLKRAKRRNHVKKAVEEVVDKLKSIENHGFASNKVKHGKIDADILYIQVYKKEIPRSKERSMTPDNDNFVVLVQYDEQKKFPITNNFIDGMLIRRIEGQIEYKWNPNF